MRLFPRVCVRVCVCVYVCVWRHTAFTCAHLRPRFSLLKRKKKRKNTPRRTKRHNETQRWFFFFVSFPGSLYASSRYRNSHIKNGEERNRPPISFIKLKTQTKEEEQEKVSLSSSSSWRLRNKKKLRLLLVLLQLLLRTERCHCHRLNLPPMVHQSHQLKRKKLIPWLRLEKCIPSLIRGPSNCRSLLDFSLPLFPDRSIQVCHDYGRTVCFWSVVVVLPLSWKLTR